MKKKLAEISLKQNLPFGDSIRINNETTKKTSLFLQNIEKKYLEDLCEFCVWKFRISPLTCPDFALTQILNPE